MIDADRIWPKLYQGSRPPYGGELHRRGFNAVVLCAYELEPFYPKGSFGPVDIISAPLDDDSINKYTLETADRASDFVVKRIRRGERVLVTCNQGRNRSGLVTALSLIKLTGMSGSAAVSRIKGLRRNALTNKQFADWLSAIPAATSSSARAT